MEMNKLEEEMKEEMKKMSGKKKESKIIKDIEESKLELK